MNAFVPRAVRTLALTAAAVLTVHVAHAQTTRSLGKANIPFDFEWSGQHLPAGQYSLDVIGKLMKISDGRRSNIMLYRDERDASDHQPSRIVFHCYGHQCFLREIWRGDESTHLFFWSSKAETRARQQTLAQNGSATGDDSVVAFQ